MDSSPWICDQCGEPNTGAICSRCGRTRGVEEPLGPAPGSYMSLYFGRGGASSKGSIPCAVAALTFLVLAVLLVFGVFR